MNIIPILLLQGSLPSIVKILLKIVYTTIDYISQQKEEEEIAVVIVSLIIIETGNEKNYIFINHGFYL